MRVFLSRHPKIVIFSCLVMLTLAVYGQVIGHEFVSLDDGAYITENAHVLKGLDPEEIWWGFTHAYDGNYIPLTWVSHMLDVQLFGVNAGWHHLMNVSLHLLSTFFLLLFLQRSTGKFWPSIFVAGLFALHPLHVESVAWAAERKDVLSALFWILTCLAYGHYVRKPSLLRYSTVLLFFILGLLAKSMLVSLPLVLLLLDAWPLGRFLSKKSWIGLLKEKIPFFMLSGIFSVVTFFAQYFRGWVNPLQTLPLDARVANAALSYVKYLGKTIWPIHLAVFYPYDRPAWLLMIKGALAVCLLGGVTVWIVRRWRQYPYLSVGWFWYLVALFPVSGILAVGGYSMADRYTYLPLIGIFIMAAWGIPDLISRWQYRGSVLRVGGVSVMVSLAFLSWIQVGYWRNTPALFGRALQITRDNHVAHIALGDYFTETGKLDWAAYHYEQAVSIRSDPSTLNNLANTYYLQGRVDDAIWVYVTIVTQDPSQVISWSNLGLMYKEKGMFDMAGQFYAEAIQVQPEYLPAYSGLAEALIMQGRFQEAFYLLRRALQMQPEDPALNHWMGVAKRKMDQAELPHAE